MRVKSGVGCVVVFVVLVLSCRFFGAGQVIGTRRRAMQQNDGRGVLMSEWTRCYCSLVPLSLWVCCWAAAVRRDQKTDDRWDCLLTQISCTGSSTCDRLAFLLPQTALCNTTQRDRVEDAGPRWQQCCVATVRQMSLEAAG